jgi:putative endonuclease
MKTYWVYIVSNKSSRVYVGFTRKLPYRVFQHKNKLYPDSFTAQYEFDMLVWCELFGNVIRARMREVEIKGWRRAKKLKLILAENADWADLSREWQDDPG